MVNHPLMPGAGTTKDGNIDKKKIWHEGGNAYGIPKAWVLWP